MKKDDNRKEVTCRSGLLALGLAMVLALAVGLMLPRARADAKAKVVTVTSINQATAKKVHKLLLKEQPFIIRIKCRDERTYIQKQFYSKFRKLANKVAKCTDEGFDVFPICMYMTPYYGGGDRFPKRSGGYTSFLINRADCREYKYGIKYARQEKKNFIAYVDKTLQQTTALIEQLEQPDIYMADETKGKAVTLEELRSTEKNLKDLSGYLHKTKFRDLSEAMKARITLGIGMSDDWRECSMGYRKGIDVFKARAMATFKKLFERKVWGKCEDYADVICKTCAVFHIGAFGKYGGVLRSGGVHTVAAVQLKTLGGKNRYLLVDNGCFAHYSSLSNFKKSGNFILYEKADRKAPTKKTIKISKKQELKDFDFYTGSIGVYQVIDGEKYYTDMKYNEFNIPKSEW